MQQQPGSDFDMNNSGIPQATTGMQNQAASKTSKQWMNTSFDASKSANTLNTINYVSSAYMSNIPTHSTQGSNHGSASNTNGKLSKVNLKHASNNSR